MTSEGQKVPQDEDMNELLKHTFKLVERGKKETRLCEDHKNVVLILGGTGAGKSTFTHWLAGDDSKLIAKEVAIGEYLIEDDGKIGRSTINSMTIFPELVVDAVHNTAFYDCPGSGDTRSTSYDLAITYLIKKVADYADSVKLVFVIRYPSVRKGVDREDFMKLMKHVTDLVKDINKFKNSIALVVTKVDNIVIRQGNNYALIEDVSIVAAIGDFLLEVKQDLRVNLQSQTCTEVVFYRNAINIIDILLTKLKNDFTRLALFRRPDESGTLDKIISFQNAKKHIQGMVLKTLDFTKKTRDDFGYGLSEKSKNDINDIVEDINEKFWSSLRIIARSVEEYFRSFGEDVQKRIQLLATATEIIDVDPEEAKIISSKFKHGHFMIEELVKRIEGMRDLEQIVLTINDAISHIGVALPQKIMQLMIDQGTYLSFLQTVCEKELRTKPWGEIFKDTLLFFKESEKDIKNSVEIAVEKINDQIISALNILRKSIEEDYNKKIPLLDVRSVLHALNEEKDVWMTKIEKIKRLTFIKELIETFCDNKSLLEVSITGESQVKMKSIENFILYLELLSDREMKMATSPWLLTLQDIIKHLNEWESWYKFLLDLYDKFSEYKVQKEKHLYNVEKIEDWEKSVHKSGILINANNFTSFLDKISNYSIAECINVKKLKLSDKKLDELNHILELTLRNKASVQCTETTLTIRGNYISLRQLFRNDNNAYVEKSNDDIKSLLASKNLKKVVFASDTIFIDQDLELVGKQLTVIILAQKWEIVGSRRIDLRGSEGDKPSTQYSSKSGNNRACDGEPGKPGGSGGNFLGLGEKFINGENLTVLVDGGKGGPGQKGQDGDDGKDAEGETVEIPPNMFKAVGSAIGTALGGYLSSASNPLLTVPLTLLATVPFISDLGSTITLGKRGGKGQDGGNGGKGGEGGYPGEITLLELGNSSGIIKSNNKGEPGEDGAGGAGGRSGMNAPGPIGVSSDSEHISSGRADSSSRNGRAGSNCIGIKSAIPRPADKDFSRVLNEYKGFLEENVNDRFKKPFLCEFLNNLNCNIDANSLHFKNYGNDI